MVKTINDITTKNYKKLSIQVALDGFSFCIIDLFSNKILSYDQVVFEKNSTIEDQLWKSFVNYPVLSGNFDEVIVLHDNNLNTFVPHTLFDKDYIGSYLQYNVKVFENDLFTSDTLENYEIENVFVPYVNVNNFLLDQYQSFQYKNVNTILVENILNDCLGSFEKQVFVHVKETHFEIVIIQNQKLLFFNSFEYITPEDFIYYLLFTFEQNHINPDSMKVQFLGIISENDELFSISYSYIRNCILFDTKKWESKFGKTAQEISNHYTLFHS